MSFLAKKADRNKPSEGVTMEHKVIARIKDVLSRVTMPSMTFHVDAQRGVDAAMDCVIYGVYLQVKCDGKCNVTGEPQCWSGRKWLLSEHMTDQEIVQTALKAVLTAQEHETREMFKYRGVPIFDPHYDIEALVALRESGAVVQRAKQPKRSAVDIRRDELMHMGYDDLTVVALDSGVPLDEKSVSRNDAVERIINTEFGDYDNTAGVRPHVGYYDWWPAHIAYSQAIEAQIKRYTMGLRIVIDGPHPLVVMQNNIPSDAIQRASRIEQRDTAGNVVKVYKDKFKGVDILPKKYRIEELLNMPYNTLKEIAAERGVNLGDRTVRSAAYYLHSELEKY